MGNFESTITHSFRKNADATIAELINAGTKPWLDHIILHHVLCADEALAEQFVTEAIKRGFDVDDPEFFDLEMMAELGNERVETIFKDGFFNIDICFESPLDINIVQYQFEQVLDLIVSIDAQNLIYSDWGSFVEDGSEDTEEESEINW